MLLFTGSCQYQSGVEPVNQTSYLDSEATFYADQSVRSIDEEASLGRRGCLEIIFPVTVIFE